MLPCIYRWCWLLQSFLKHSPVASLSRQGTLSCYLYSHFTDEKLGLRKSGDYPEYYCQFNAVLSTGCCLRMFCLLISWSPKESKFFKKEKEKPIFLCGFKIWCHLPSNTFHIGQEGGDIFVSLSFLLFFYLPTIQYQLMDGGGR